MGPQALGVAERDLGSDRRRADHHFVRHSDDLRKLQVELDEHSPMFASNKPRPGWRRAVPTWRKFA